MSIQPLSDVAKTAVLTDLVRERHPQREAQNQEAMGAVWAVLHEVPPATGWAGRYADVVALHLWPSELSLVGYEVKASRADLKRELADLSKHRAVARYCDAWWLVAWDRKWVDGETALPGIPETWGLLAYEAARTGTAHEGVGELALVRRAAPLAPDPWPRVFTAALVRRALEASVGTALARQIGEGAALRAQSDGERRGRAKANEETLKALAPWREAMRGENAAHLAAGGSRWSLPAGDPDNLGSVLGYLAKRAPNAEPLDLFAARGAEARP